MIVFADDQVVCGSRQWSKSFMEAIRPTSDGKCPDLKVPCSNNTSPENTICVSPYEQESGLSCPITDIRIMKEEEVEDLDLSEYVIQSFR